MYTDDIFRIGLKHIKSGFPCEDYSLSGYSDKNKNYYMAVSDGCSGSDGMTDVGARLWCLSFLNVVKNSKNDQLFFDEDFVLRVMREFNKISMLPSRSDETASINFFIGNESNAQILIFGDGGYSIERNDGTIEINEFSWYKNKPYYPIFKLESEIRGNDIFLDHFREKDIPLMKKETKYFVKEKKAFSKGVYTLIDKEIKGYYFEDIEFGYSKLLDKDRDNIKSISIFSDGLWTIQKYTLNQIISDFIQTVDVVKEYGFLKKRVVPIFEIWQKTAHYPLDDFSISQFIW